ncbi:hypothetical protein D3C84_779950 [compost metagenome]
MLVVHVTALFDAVAGLTVAVNVAAVPPFNKLSVGWSNVTPVTKVVTVTVLDAVKLPSAVVTVIVAVPLPTGVTTPFATVATLALLEVHVTFLFDAAAGLTVAVNVPVAPPVTRFSAGISNVTPVTGVVTVTVHVAVKLPSVVLTVIVAVPLPTGVTTPFATVATLALLVVHVTALFDAAAGLTVAVNVPVAPPGVRFIVD